MVKRPGRIAVRRSARNSRTTGYRNSTAVPAQLAQALASPRPPVSSPPSNSRPGSSGEPAVVGATPYKPPAVSLRGSTRSLALKAGEPLEISSNQGCNALQPTRVLARSGIAPKEAPTATTASKQPNGEVSDEMAVPALFETRIRRTSDSHARRHVPFGRGDCRRARNLDVRYVLKRILGLSASTACRRSRKSLKVMPTL